MKYISKLKLRRSQVDRCGITISNNYLAQLKFKILIITEIILRNKPLRFPP